MFASRPPHASFCKPGESSARRRPCWGNPTGLVHVCLSWTWQAADLVADRRWDWRVHRGAAPQKSITTPPTLPGTVSTGGCSDTPQNGRATSVVRFRAQKPDISAVALPVPKHTVRDAMFKSEPVGYRAVHPPSPRRKVPATSQHLGSIPTGSTGAFDQRAKLHDAGCSDTSCQ